MRWVPVEPTPDVKQEVKQWLEVATPESKLHEAAQILGLHGADQPAIDRSADSTVDTPVGNGECQHRRLRALTRVPRCADCGEYLTTEVLGKSGYVPKPNREDQNSFVGRSVSSVLYTMARLMMEDHEFVTNTEEVCGTTAFVREGEKPVYFGPYDEKLDVNEYTAIVVPMPRRMFAGIWINEDCELKVRVLDDQTVEFSRDGDALVWRRLRLGQCPEGWELLKFIPPFALFVPGDRGIAAAGLPRPTPESETWQLRTEHAFMWNGVKPAIEHFDDGFMVQYRRAKLPDYLVNNQFVRTIFNMSVGWWSSVHQEDIRELVHYSTLNNLVPLVGDSSDYARVAAKHLRKLHQDSGHLRAAARDTARQVHDTAEHSSRGKLIRTYLTTTAFLGTTLGIPMSLAVSAKARMTAATLVIGFTVGRALSWAVGSLDAE